MRKSTPRPVLQRSLTLVGAYVSGGFADTFVASWIGNITYISVLFFSVIFAMKMILVDHAPHCSHRSQA